MIWALSSVKQFVKFLVNPPLNFYKFSKSENYSSLALKVAVLFFKNLIFLKMNHLM